MLLGPTSGMGDGWCGAVAVCGLRVPWEEAAAHCDLETPVPARNVELTPALAPSARGHKLGMQISRRSMLARVDVPLAALTTPAALIYVRPYYLTVVLGQ